MKPAFLIRRGLDDGEFFVSSPGKTAKVSVCTNSYNFGTNKKNMGQDAPHFNKLPPRREIVETVEILRQTNKSTAATCT